MGSAFNWATGSGFPVSQKCPPPPKKKKFRNFIFCSAGCSIGGLDASPVAWKSFIDAMEPKNKYIAFTGHKIWIFSTEIFWIFGHQKLGSGSGFSEFGSATLFICEYFKLVGFGLACLPVRCAHPSFWEYCYAKRGAARPPTHRSFAALYSSAKKYNFTISRN